VREEATIVADSELDSGDRALDRARKLVALDRALIEIGEPGVLERAPEDVASLEARLFGPLAGIPAGEGGAGEAGPGAAPPDPEPEPPALRLMTGSLRRRPAVDQARRQALRAQLRLIPGGRQAV
jgi:hypothetical protein